MTEEHCLADRLATPAVQPAYWHWYVEGVRSAFLQAPRWERLAATPVVLALLVLVLFASNILLEWLYIEGDAVFHWQGLLDGWFVSAAAAWVCYLLRPRSGDAAPGAAQLFCLFVAQAQIIFAVTGLAFLLLVKQGWYSMQVLGVNGVWVVWSLPLVWLLFAQTMMLARIHAQPHLLFVAVLVLSAATLATNLVRPGEFWRTDGRQTDAQREPFYLTQEVMEAQPQLLALRLQEIRRQRPGVVDMFVVSFAPYSDEDVFQREAAMVADVMAQRFDADGRTIQLINNTKTIGQWPWATPRNLQRTIEHIASKMDRDEDVLFLHLTSHGARNGQLAAEFWPMTVDPVTPFDLKLWLAEAGIKYSVISISACYSGSWIAPLADDNTLVMTAADADHTSYGCGRLSELTFFGRAMYDELLRNETLSFEQAHAKAREIIKAREEEAGKDDGYSNPQISTGSAIRTRLARLQSRLEKTGPR